MTAARQYPPITCDKHPSSFLLDTLEPDGVTISHLCTLCQTAAGDPLVEVNVVRGLHRRASELAAEREAVGNG